MSTSLTARNNLTLMKENSKFVKEALTDISDSYLVSNAEKRSTLRFYVEVKKEGSFVPIVKDLFYPENETVVSGSGEFKFLDFNFPISSVHSQFIKDINGIAWFIVAETTSKVIARIPLFLLQCAVFLTEEYEDDEIYIFNARPLGLETIRIDEEPNVAELSRLMEFTPEHANQVQ